MKKTILIISFLVFYVFIVNAQEKQDIRGILSGFKPGQIIASDEGYFNYTTLRLTDCAYDVNIIGVFKYDLKLDNPRIMPNPVQQEGIIKVQFSNENGPVKKGDLLTSSLKPGTAMKATKPGMIIGVAMENSNEGDDYVKIRIMIQYATPSVE